MQQVREKIRSLRQAKGYSQECMAHLLGLTQATYSRLETGQTELSLAKLVVLPPIPSSGPSMRATPALISIFAGPRPFSVGFGRFCARDFFGLPRRDDRAGAERGTGAGGGQAQQTDDQPNFRRQRGLGRWGLAFLYAKPPQWVVGEEPA